jgi:hypothetical protein
MTMSDTPATTRGVAMAQHDLPLGGSLRRRSDRLRTVAGCVLALAALGVVVVAWVCALSAHRNGLDRIRHDAAARTTVVGVLLDDAAPVGREQGRPVRVSYVDVAGRPHVGQVPATGLRAGTPVRVEVDGDGRVGVDPPTSGDALLSAITVAAGVVVLGGMVLVLSWLGLCALITAHNHAAWEREWRDIEPQWSGRGRRV